MNPYTTERLTVRHLEETDLEPVHRVIYSDPDVCHFFCLYTRPIEKVRQWLPYRSYQSRNDQWGLMAVEITATGELIGLVGIQPDAVPSMVLEVDPYRRPTLLDAELTYVFGKDYWGKGYATEACIPMIDYAFRVVKLDRLVTGCDPLNERAARLQTRLGMRKVRNIHPDAAEGMLIGILDNLDLVQPA